MRHLLITGVSSGIGLAICQRLLQLGHNVLGISRKKPPIEHPAFSFYSLDLAKIALLPDAFLKLSKEFPKIDGVIFNAARGHFGNLEEISFEKMKELMDLNYLSHAYLAKVFLPLLKQKPRGDLIFIGSEAALKGKKKGSIYCSSKFALRGFAQALREECASSSVRVSQILPGMARTPFYDELSFEPGVEEEAALQPEDIASCVELILSMDKRAVCDEIVLSPLKKTISFKKNKQNGFSS